MSDEKEWNPAIYQCRECFDMIWSEHPGQFVTCDCGSISVDQTRSYGRFIGDQSNFWFVGYLNGEETE